jgi:hypothetical protein
MTTKELLEKHAKLNPDSVMILTRANGLIGVDISISGDPLHALYFLSIFERHVQNLIVGYEQKVGEIVKAQQAQSPAEVN